MWLPRSGWVEGVHMVKGYQLPVLRLINSEDVMYSLVTIVNKPVLYI